MKTAYTPLKTGRFFITGTDTGVGKTRIAVALCRTLVQRGLRVTAMKPVASGCISTDAGLRSEDALALQRAINVRIPYDEINPYAFKAAIAPHIAAKDIGCKIDFEVLDRAYQRMTLQSDITIVEGAGGWLAPLDAVRSFADLAGFWQLEVILVVGMRLGCLNHALLTAEAIERRGLRLRGWVASVIDPHFERLEENLSILQIRLAQPRLGVFPFVPQLDDDAVLPEFAI